MSPAGDDWSVSIESVGKQYLLGERQSYGSLRDSLVDGVRSLAGRRGDRPEPQLLWALRGVSAQIAPGEIVGLIGRNGAGKSTLLKLISRVTSPTEGRIRVRGQIGSLLEVGAGFHPELTGRENVFLNGSILGMGRREIAAKLDEIVAFSELAEFMSTPVKRYSVGMYMRLAFTVAAHLDTEVLAIDEVLAVGDERFQRKCLAKISDVAQAGRTVLFVSHNLETTTKLCDRALLFDRGALVADGPSHEVAGRYLAMSGVVAHPDVPMDLVLAQRSGTGEARFRTVTMLEREPLTLDLEIEAVDDLDVPSLGVTVTSESGVLLVSSDSARLDTGPVRLRRGANHLRVTLSDLPLNAGRYRVGLRLANPITTRIGSGAYDQLEPAFIVQIDTDVVRPGTRPDGLLTTELAVHRPD